MRPGCVACGPACRHRLASGLCVLDVVDAEGPLTLETTGALLNVGGEAVRIIEVKALRKLRVRLAALGVHGDVLLGELASGVTWNGEP